MNQANEESLQMDLSRPEKVLIGITGDAMYRWVILNLQL